LLPRFEAAAGAYRPIALRPLTPLMQVTFYVTVVASRIQMFERCSSCGD
jgi:hypothetical protein